MARAKPVSTEDRKAIGARLKAGRERAAAEKAELIRLREENAKLREAPTEAKRKEQPNESRDWKDDLEWIDETVHAVAIVSKNMTITLRPMNDRVLPVMPNIAIHHTGSGPWIANPFDLRSNDPGVDARAQKEKMNAVLNANWGYFRITRELAKDVYADSRYPVPKEAVVDAREFSGWDREVNRAVGVYRPLGDRPDVLRECVRFLIQRLPNTFIDASRHGAHVVSPLRPVGFDPRNPNPYRRTLGTLALKMPPVQLAGETK